MTRDMADISMLELFKMEARSHSQSLNEGLAELKNEQSPDRLEPLMRAAHSLKGAGRIVNINEVVGLAGAMEDILEKCRKGEKSLSDTDIDRLAAATFFFSAMGELDMNELSGWLDENAAAMEAATDELEKPSDMENVHEAEKTAEQTDPADSTADLSPKNQETDKPDIPLADMSMLELFRMEAESHSQSLGAGLLELEKNQSPDRVEPLMRAAHSMKGAARIVGLSDAVALAHAMEDLLVSCQKGETTLNSSQIDLLLAATDIYKDISQLDTDSVQNYLTGKKALMDCMEKALRGDQNAARDVLSRVRPGGVPLSAVEQETVEETPVEATTQVLNSPPVREKTDGQSAPASEVPNKIRTDSVVRVSAGNLNRLMALAGESLVESGRLSGFTTSLLRIKSGQRELMQALEQGCERVIKGETPSTVLGELKTVLTECQLLLAKHINEFDLYCRRSDNVSERLYHEVIASRMRPFSDGGRGFPRLVRDLSRSLDKEVDFVIEGENTSVDRDILERLEAPLNHLIRNAVDHGIELPDERRKADKNPVGTIRIIAGHRAGMLFIEVRDDGKGIDPERIRTKVVERKLAPARMAAEMSRAELMEFLFLPGFSTAGKVTEISGRGVGLDVVHAMVQEVGGTVRAESEPGKGMSFSMQLPLTLSVIRTLLVEISGQPYAIPLSRISRIASINSTELQLVEDRQYINLNGHNVGLVPAAQVLGTTFDSTDSGALKVVVISDRMNRYGLVVDNFLGEQDLVVRPLDQRLGKVPDVNSVALMPDGSPVLILDAEDLVRSIDNLLSGGRLGKVGIKSREVVQVQRILVVDDSLTVREVERKLLANHGYNVDTAVDGQDGLNAILAGEYDLVITDVDMPRMNGLELTGRIKSDPDLKSIPVMMVSYKDRKEDRLRGLEAGADYYLTKSSFHDETLLSAVEDLIGEAGK